MRGRTSDGVLIMSRKSKTHRFVVTIRTNKECTRKVALREMRDTVYGLHYCTELDEGDPETFRIGSIRHHQEPRS